MFFIALIGVLIFITINISIVYIDYREKRIPNRYLGFLVILLLVFYGYNIVEGSHGLQFVTIGIHFFLAIIISFLLYYYGVWSAGDAKYLLVLSLYLPTIGIVSLIGNLALITIIYLFGYYIYFYTRFFFRGKRYIASFWRSISVDKKDTWKMFISRYYTDKSVVWRLFRFVLMFLVFFVSIRLIRGYLMTEVQSIESVHSYILQYPSYSAFFIGGAFFGIFYLFRILSSRVKAFFSRRFSDSRYVTHAEHAFPFILFVLLGGFIFFEYRINPTDIQHKLFLIFTVYLALYLVIKVLYYSYKVTFQLSEQDTITLSKLKAGDIVDKEYLIKLFGSQKSLGYLEEDGILAPNPSAYFQRMSNPIDQETLLFLKKIYKIVNTYHKEQKTPGFEKLENIKVLRTFAFGGYIFAGFLITYIWGDTPIRFLMESLLQVLHSMR